MKPRHKRRMALEYAEAAILAEQWPDDVIEIADHWLNGLNMGIEIGRKLEMVRRAQARAKFRMKQGPLRLVDEPDPNGAA